MPGTATARLVILGQVVEEVEVRPWRRRRFNSSGVCGERLAQLMAYSLEPIQTGAQGRLTSATYDPSDGSPKAAELGIGINPATVCLGTASRRE